MAAAELLALQVGVDEGVACVAYTGDSFKFCCVIWNFYLEDVVFSENFAILVRPAAFFGEYARSRIS